MKLTTEQQQVVNELLAPGYDNAPFMEGAWTGDDEDFFCEDALYWLVNDFPGYENLSVDYGGEDDDAVYELRGEIVSVLGREHTRFTNLSQIQKDIIQSSQDAGCRTITEWWNHINEKVDEFLEERGISSDIQDTAAEEGWEEEWLDTLEKIRRALWGFGDDGFYFPDKQIQRITD